MSEHPTDYENQGFWWSWYNALWNLDASAWFFALTYTLFPAAVAVLMFWKEGRL